MYPASHHAEAKASLVRIQEIQKYAKVLPHCSAPVRLNHLARCRPLKGSYQGQSESFESLFYQLSALALAHQNKQRPLPRNNFPKIPRRSKHKRLSSHKHQHSQPRPAPEPDASYRDFTASSTTTARNYPNASNATASIQSDRNNSVQKSFTTPNVTATSETSVIHEDKSSRVQTPVIIVSTPLIKKTMSNEKLLKRDKSYTELSKLLSDKFQGNIENLNIPDIRLISPCQFIDVLEMLKQKAINLEIEIQKTAKIESPTEARQHIQSLERSLIKVMPLMNLLTSLVRFNHMYEEHKRSDSREDDTVFNKKEVIEVKTYDHTKQLCFVFLEPLV